MAIFRDLSGCQYAFTPSKTFNPRMTASDPTCKTAWSHCTNFPFMYAISGRCNWATVPLPLNSSLHMIIDNFLSHGQGLPEYRCRYSYRERMARIRPPLQCLPPIATPRQPAHPPVRQVADPG